LLERATTITGASDLGLRLGLRFRLEHHGMLGALMATTPTLGDALLDFQTSQPGYSSGAIIYVHDWGDDVAFGYAACSGTVTASAQLYQCIAETVSVASPGVFSESHHRVAHASPKD
jgi:hypothetical protein